ncbi:hypothetical protein VC83_09429 [Pseudogymnoascus destructans]|uniref:Uncharacterized protein n=1 Tax=Pseudogymnoascus destructans TaxID=655981 RepID=A0A176ZYK9_9PEZI|nr:uncharacterized protein VC83_09429 [Pseudogymnoascus destructans]OAF54400.1 hypothetical protein VC83_09429 [Pseudogymnoascus destructans]
MPPRQTHREVAASLEHERSGVAALENTPEESGASSPLSQPHRSPGVEAQLATALALEAEEEGERIRRLQERLERVGQEEASPHTLRSDERSVMTTVSSTSHAGVPRSLRSRAIPEYRGKNVREHNKFITSCELTFRFEPLARTDEFR